MDCTAMTCSVHGLEQGSGHYSRRGVAWRFGFALPRVLILYGSHSHRLTCGEAKRHLHPFSPPLPFLSFPLSLPSSLITVRVGSVEL